MIQNLNILSPIETISMIKNYYFSLQTSRREEFIDITAEIDDFVRKSKIRTGFCKIFVPHTKKY